MADSARENLDEIISIAAQDAAALQHLANVMAENKKRHDPDTDGMIGSLVRSSNQMKQYCKDLEEVRAIYDSKVHGAPVS